jgi:acetyl esterase/lipase/endonuclease/exonuclease/phosphatase family metal-dependent hydrolase
MLRLSNPEDSNMRGIAFLLLGFLAVWQLGGPAFGQESPPEVRVMSFNIRYGTADDGENRWERRKEFLAETIAAFHPDLLGTQETLGFQRDYLAEKLAGYEVLGVGRDDGKEKGEMMALYYNKGRFKRTEDGHFWLSETSDEVGSKSWDSSLPRMVTWVKLTDLKKPAAPPVAFFNTHFDHRGTTARLESARLLRMKIAEIGKGCSVVLTGDFNTAEKSEPYAALFAKGADQESPVVDTFRVKHPDATENEGTFSNFKRDAVKGARIDWIGASRDWEVMEAGIDRTAKEGRTPSDHFAVTAVLRLKTAEKEAAVARPKEPTLVGGSFKVESIKDVPYYEGPDADPIKHKLDLFLPKGHKDFPVLIFVHGGAWVTGDRNLYGSFGRTFAKNGIGTAVISYRLTPKVQHPGHIEDVARAFAWIHKNIAKYGGRPDQIFVTGQSAGGHLTALLATNETYLAAQGLSLKDIKGAVPISGVYQFSGRWSERIIGKGQAATDSASPLRQVTGKEPPFLILYADSDMTGCARMSQQFSKLLEGKQVETAVKEIKDRNHITIMVLLMLSDADPCAQELLKFVAQHSDLKLTPRGEQPKP